LNVKYKSFTVINFINQDIAVQIQRENEKQRSIFSEVKCIHRKLESLMGRID